MKPAKAQDDSSGTYPPAHRSSWLEDDDHENLFDGIVTLDPGRVLWAWDRLSQDTWALEFGSAPRVMHDALLSTLKERGWAR